MKLKLRVAPFVQLLAVAVASLLRVPSADAASKIKVLYNFNYTYGNGGGQIGPPSSPLLLDRSGNLYGVAGGGKGCDGWGCGVVFELPQADDRSLVVLHNFLGGSDGAYPWGGLIPDNDGNLYGTVMGYPGLDVGGAFELAPRSTGWSGTVIYTDGAGPGLLSDQSGNLYGTIGPGEDYGLGAIGELSPGSSGWTYTQLYSFCGQYNCPGGYGPMAPPVWDNDGNLYGTMYYGGLGYGVVFQMTPNKDGTWAYHVLHRFGSFPTDAEFPRGGLVRDASGAVYGTAVFGGIYKHGRVFKLARTSNGHWKETSVYDFPNCGNGCVPSGTMVSDKAGALYGVSSGGLLDCPGGCGVVFKLTPEKSGKRKYSVVYKFHGTDGNGPNDVILDDRGHLFGTTSSGGTYNWGVAFEITP